MTWISDEKLIEAVGSGVKAVTVLSIDEVDLVCKELYMRRLLVQEAVTVLTRHDLCNACSHRPHGREQCRERSQGGFMMCSCMGAKGV
jgi:hypothetical protein